MRRMFHAPCPCLLLIPSPVVDLLDVPSRLMEQELKKYDIDYKLVLTERPWHAAELTEQGARDGYETVISCQR